MEERKKMMNIEVGGIGKVRLEQTDLGTFLAYDEQGMYLGEIDPNEVEEWTEDEYALTAILEELFDLGVLELPTADGDYFDADS